MNALNSRASSAARDIGLLLLMCGLFLSGALVCRGQTSADVIVYGSTPGGFCAAISAAREGASVILLEPTSHVGGMNTGGLCFSDSDQMHREQLMGLFHQWHLRIQQDYDKRGITLPYDVRVKNQATWSYEAHVAQRVTDAMLAEAGVKVLTGRYLRSVTKSGPRITGIVTSNGAFSGRVFIDGSYEGDLMAAAGVSWRIDRESRAEYGESHAGRQYPKSLMDIEGFDSKGNPLPLITAVGKGPDDIGDDELMVYSFRIPMTKNAVNKVAMPAPTNYDPSRFELVRRYVKRHGESKVNFSYLPVPNNKIDANNAIGSQFSIGLVGGAKEWATADQTGRAAILEAHKQYTLEFIHFMKTDPVFSQARRDDIAGWGLCADEFAAYGHFPPQLYVRESRRMKGMYVMTQADLLDNIVKPDPIMVASFPIDSHDCRRVAIKGGGVINEGTIFPVRQMPKRIGYPYHVPYRAILPKANECDNLLVPVAMSCTHVAMSSLRIEATWMLIGQSAGIAAALAADQNVAVQDLPYATLKPRLEAHGQVLTLPKGFQPAEKPISGEASQSLNGVWRFTTNVSNPPASWVDMTVPGNWDSTAQFSTYVGVGWYRRTFTPDPALQGKSVRLHFGAVYHEAEVFLNGVSIGTHVGGYTPFEFDVTKHLNFGQPNEITVRADNTYKRGAWWPWGGISRSVSLIGNNPVRLVWQHIHGDPDLAAGTATVHVKFRLQNTGAAPAAVTIRSRLASWDKELVNATHTVNAGETKDVTARFNLPAARVRLWHFDHPEFYHLETTLTVSGQVQYAVGDRFGIRKIEVSATEFRLNGEPVRLVGFNRLADDAGPYGNTEPDVLVNADVDLMKRAGA
ncbi:MAG: FAD-dependent oxidoreductase, partial [Verrucomicrobia bacterium]|nr:FAD-dependent oxidoreductase [Verrucomicrobiota bacterium]